MLRMPHGLFAPDPTLASSHLDLSDNRTWQQNPAAAEASEDSRK
eukprot:CAMPEP_0197726688 /NCGR_PEP_ID=MMETSP1434-20131217/16760_1 /TAXON_ID=265543 /ORGANISM="Minutocellus polymorphus, Strain CCMP3303" /LENGTH=43 /DNA_ID= /DNA_START= /DNA_END= /DNA_ORIENTATION=